MMPRNAHLLLILPFIGLGAWLWAGWGEAVWLEQILTFCL
jgi:hypothetical protein